jgi:uncharacterized protein YhaN
MKILQLNLLAFGPFTEVLLDFSEGHEGLHILYGPNEAGKSSALRALRQMLYGIPVQSPDDFIHPYAKLRIGAMLRHSDGSVIDVVRKKGKINTLFGSDDGNPVDEALFQKFLGNIDEDVFKTMFGIGHEDLVKGGEEIIKGGGDVGQALFAAGAGISDLRQVQMDLQKEAEALFKPAAPTKTINVFISKFKENKKKLKEIQLPGQEWERHDKALHGALKRRDEVDRELVEKQAECRRLERIRDALPHIAKRRELIEELRPYKGAIILPDDFDERHQHILTELRIAEKGKEQAATGIEDIESELGLIELPEDLLEKAELVEDVYRELGGYQKAAKDLPDLKRRRDILWSDAKNILKSLRDDLTLEEAEKLRLKKADSARIRDLGTTYEKLVTKLEKAREVIPKLSQKIERLEKQLTELEETPPLDDLKRAVEKAMRSGPIEERYQDLLRELEKDLASLEMDIQKQSIWSGSHKELEELPLPSMETVDLFTDRFDEAHRTLKQLQIEKDRLEKGAIETEGQIKELQLEQEVPTEEDLIKLRRERDRGWQLVRRRLDQIEGEQSEYNDYIRAIEGAETLEGAFELLVKEADEVADRLRREADRVAKKAKLISDLETLKRQAGHLTDKIETTESETKELNREWSELWERLSIKALTPKEMRAWVRTIEVLRLKAFGIRDKKSDLKELKDKIDAHREELSQRLGSLTQPLPEAKESLSELIGRSQSFIQEHEEIKKKRENILWEKDQREGELSEAKFDLERIQEDLSDWQRQWEGAVKPLGLGADSLPGQANVVIDELKELFEKLREAGILNSRINGIDRDSREFSKNVARLAEQVAPELKDKSVEQAAVELNGRLTRAREDRSKRQGLETQRVQKKEQLQEFERRILELKLRLDGLCEEASCREHGDIGDAVKRSSMRKRIETDLKNTEEQLLRLSAGATIEEFVSETEEVDVDGIDGRIGLLNDETKALYEERSKLDQTIGEERNELGKMDGSAEAAELAEESQGILARLESEAIKYTRLRLASALLAKAIEGYREKHQGPVLKRAGEFFSQLTLGFFDGMRAEFDEKDKPVLMGVRPGGKELVGVEGMSDGTTDQLYLSLRLSSLESYLENNEPMPFIVDDILIKFDNERATATLKVLAELSTKTQVIFFTHHRHLVELAEANIHPSTLFKHTLDMPRYEGSVF